ADRTRVEVAFTHHDAAHGDERSGGKTEFFCAEQSCDDYIAPSLELAVGLQADATTKVVEQENLLRFGQAEFPWDPSMLDRTERRCACASAVPTDKDDVCMCFCNSSC